MRLAGIMFSGGSIEFMMDTVGASNRAGVSGMAQSLAGVIMPIAESIRGRQGERN